jgi:hypothetical protein
MRTHPLLLVVAGLICTACEDSGAPSDDNALIAGTLLIRTTMTGLDLDRNGYRVEVDGATQAFIERNGVAHVLLAPGSWTVGLADLAQNCTIDGPTTQTVTIVNAKISPIDFAIVCTATSGVIGIITQASGAPGEAPYEAIVDGRENLHLGTTGRGFLDTVPAGEHTVSLLAPANCVVEINPRSVTVSTGGLIRDTVEATFAVSCVRRFTTLQITAQTTGSIPADDYLAWGCPLSGMYCWDFLVGPLGRLTPNGTLTAQVPLNVRRVELTDLPPNCRVLGPNPSPQFQLTYGSTHSIEFSVACSP